MKKLVLSLLGLAVTSITYAQCNLTGPATLPYTQNFNSLSGVINTDSVFICDPSSSWSFESPASNAQLNLGIPSGTSGIQGDFQGSSLGMASVTTSDTANIVFTIDLSNLIASAPEDIWIDFHYADFADEDSPADRVFLRGSNTDSWIDIFDWNTGSPSDWESARIKIDSALSANGQNFSSTTQIRWTQVDNVGLTGGDGFGLDQFSIISSTTAMPSALSISNITGTTADVSWTGNGPNTQFAVINVGGYWPAATPQVFSGVNTGTLTGLMPSTNYELWFRDSTAVGNTSLWRGPFFFQTACQALSAPYFTDFDATADGDVEICWAQYNNYSTSAYARVEALSSSNATQPLSGANVLEIYSASGFSAGDTLVAITPELSDLTASDKQIRFHAATNDLSNRLIVATLDNNTTSASITIIDTITFQQANTWQENIIYFDATNGYNGTDKYIALIHTLGGTFDDIYIDDFHYEDIPACPTISGVFFNGITGNSAVMNYATVGDSIQIEWGPAGYAQGTGCVGNVSNSGSVTISDLLDPSCVLNIVAQSDYDVYVRNNCTTAGNGFSAWAGPFTFTTGCATIVPPSLEDFSNGWTPDACWEQAGSGTPSTGPSNFGTSSWTADGFANNGSTGAVKVNVFTTGKEEWMLSPSYDLGTLGDMQVELDFGVFTWNTSNPANLGSDDEIHILISTDNGVSWTALDTIDNTFTTLPNGNRLVYTLGSYTGIVQFGIWAYEGTVNDPEDVDVMVDNFQVRQTPNCASSTAIMLDSVSTSSVSLSWTAGSGVSFQVQVDTVGFTPGNGRFGDTVTVTNATIFGLSPSTSYEVYIRDVCATGNGQSAWAGPILVRTACPNVFASPILFDLEDLSIGNRSPFLNCWTTDKTSNPRWEIEEANGTDLNSSNTGPDYDKTLNGQPGGKYWFLETSGGALGNEANLLSPYFSLNGMVEPSLYFWYHMYGAAMGNLHVDIEHQGTWYNDYFLITGQQDTSGADDWNQLELNLAGFVNDTIRVRFRGERGSSFTSDMSIDDIEIAEASPCHIPVNLQAINLTATSTDVSWSSYGNQFNLVWGPSGFLQGTNTSGGTLISNASNPTSISGLSPNNFYDVYVQDTCDTNMWVGPLTIKTPCLSALAAGTYTIGTGPADDFASFDSVATLLNGCGISGPVIFNVQPGSYTDKLHLQFVPGVTSTNTITFNGTGGSDSLIYNGQSFQTAVLIEGTSYVTLNDMTIVNPNSAEAFGILLKDNSDSVTINNSTILMDTTSTSTSNDIVGILTAAVYDNDNSEGSEVDYLTIDGNTIIGGITGINIEGNGTGDFTVGHRIWNNTIQRQNTYGIYLDELSDIEVIGNRVDRVRATTDGLFALDVNDFRVEENVFYVSDFGLYILDGNDGFNPAQRSVVINNMVSSTSDYGIYLNDFEQVEVYHNTAYGSPGMAINDQDSVWVINNVFVSDNDFAFESFDNFNGTETIDYNLYESGNSNAFDIGTASYTDLAAWVAADPTHNANSVSGDPVFVSKPLDLHLVGTLANDVGDNSLGITVDIDGDTRPLSPSTVVDMGADEYTPLTDDAEMVRIIASSGCGGSATAVSVVFRNLGLNTINSLPINVNLSGGISLNLSATYTGSLASLDQDTLLVGTYNTYAGANGVLIDAILSLTGDQDASNDSIRAGAFDYIPFEPIGIDSSYCSSDDTAYLRASAVNGVNYAWFATNNANDTIPLATGDTLAVASGGAQSTYFLAYASSVDSLGTPFAGGNGLDGNVFDILPSSNIELTGVDVNLDATTAQNVSVFIRTGTSVGNESTLTGWTLIDSATVTGNGAGNATFLPFGRPYPIFAGQTYGLMVVVTTSGQVDYTDGTAVGAILAQNDDLTIFEGSGISWPLGSVFNPRFWNGRVYYNADACSDIRVPVNLTLGADTAIANFTTSGTQPTFNFDATASINGDVYTWDFGDGNVGTGITTSHTYSANGVYNVVLTVEDTTACTSVAVDSASIEVNIGLEENPIEGSLAVFPNPAVDQVQIEFDVVNSAKASIRLVDAQGRTLISESSNAQGATFKHNLNLNGIASGVYVIEIQSGELVAQRRLRVN